jgi:hypothetical protein
MLKPDPMEWVKINRHLQAVGTATCDVSNLILQADDAREAGDSRSEYRLMSAARDVLAHRKLARRSRAKLAEEKPRKRNST